MFGGEKRQSVLAVTNGVSLICWSVWSNIYRKPRSSENRAALKQLRLPAITPSHKLKAAFIRLGENTETQCRNFCFFVSAFSLTLQRKKTLLAHFGAVAA